MEKDERYGTPNRSGRSELSRFAFLIGTWKGEAKLEREDGDTDRLTVEWEGRYILDGYAIADEYRMTTAEGELLVLGVNIRAWDPRKRAWSMKWLNAFDGTWTDLGPDQLGGVEAGDDGITYRIEEPVAGHAITRATYCNISADRFTWRGERLTDGETWEKFLVVELHRA